MNRRIGEYPYENETNGSGIDNYSLPGNIFLIAMIFFIIFSIGGNVYGADAWTGTADQFKTFTMDIWAIGRYICYLIALVIFAFGGYQWGRNHNMVLGIEMIVVGIFFCAIPWFVSLFSSSAASSDPFQ